MGVDIRIVGANYGEETVRQCGVTDCLFGVSGLFLSAYQRGCMLDKSTL
jgi:hypothetical protein